MIFVDILINHNNQRIRLRRISVLLTRIKKGRPQGQPFLISNL